IDGARISLESAIAMAQLGGSARITLWALGWLARVQFLTGEWDRALQTVEQGRALAASSGIVLTTPLLEWTAAEVHALRGNSPDAATAARTADAVTQDYDMMRIPTLLARAQIAEAEADYGKVRAALEPLTRMTSGTAVNESGLWPWADVMANALVLDGQPDSADAFLRPHEERARAQGRRSAMARLGYARGRQLGAIGDLAAARRSFDESLELLDGTPLRYDLARVNFAYGQTELTPQEEAVTSLVAQGLSNREVAAELYVSPKTVQYHLTRIYAKLGIRSRSELAALRR